MSNHSVLESQQSQAGAASARTLAGCWILPPRRALGLYPTQRARLRVERGGVWLTVTGRKGALPGDWFLGEGDEQVLEPGVHAVIEPWHGGRPRFRTIRWPRACNFVGMRSPCQRMRRKPKSGHGASWRLGRNWWALCVARRGPRPGWRGGCCSGRAEAVGRRRPLGPALMRNANRLERLFALMWFQHESTEAFSLDGATLPDAS